MAQVCLAPPRDLAVIVLCEKRTLDQPVQGSFSYLTLCGRRQLPDGYFLSLEAEPAANYSSL